MAQGHFLVFKFKTFPNGRPVFLVDTQPGAGNNPWQPHMQLAGVIDHHPWREQSGLALFFDVRSRFCSAAITNVGTMVYPNMAAEMADLLIRLQNMDWVVCLGVYQQRVLLAVRSSGVQGDAGSLVRAIVQTDGTAGGHDNMAGGQIPLQNISAGEMIDRLTRRALQALGIEPDALPLFLV